MHVADARLALLSLIWLQLVYAKIGYFWHITDLHYDPFNTMTSSCSGRADARSGQRSRTPPTPYECDSAWELIESAAAFMRARHPETVEFVLWTGDIVSSSMDSATEELRLSATQNVTDLLSRAFSSQFVFPVLGHTDPLPSRRLSAMWMHWLPTEALQTFEYGGFYTIEQSHTKLRIVALNTNLLLAGADSRGRALAAAQWQWLEAVLEKAKDLKEMVYIVGHVPPGAHSALGARAGPRTALWPLANARYLRLLRRYAPLIAGQFYGHHHEDTFRLFYSDSGKPISWIMIAPSVTPKHLDAGHTNPGLRLYKFDSSSGKILDYSQYYLDLSSRTPLNELEWQVEYNFTHYYGLRELSASALHSLAERLAHSQHADSAVFAKYMQANSVRAQDAWAACDGVGVAACAHAHYCAITRLHYAEYRQCANMAASALASRASAPASGMEAALLAIGLIITLAAMELLR